MITEVIKIQADLKNATKEIEKLNSSIVDLQKEQKKQSEDAIAQAKKQQKATEKTNGILKKTAKGFKGIGLAMKAAGFGLILKGVDMLTQALMRNQEIADAVNVVFTAIGIVFKQIVDAIKVAYDRVSELTGGFDALKAVVGGALTVALNSLLLIIQGLQYGFGQLKVAYEKVFGDEAGVKKAQKNLRRLEKDMKETTKRIADGGKQIANNAIEAIQEVATLAEEVTKSTSDAVQDINMATVVENAKTLVELKNNYELLALQQERVRQKAEQEAETFRTIRDDATRSIEDRILANEEFIKANERAVKAEQDALQNRIDAIKQTIELEGENVELKNQLYSLNTELEAIELKRIQIEKENKLAGNALQVEKNNLIDAELQGINELKLANERFKAEQEKNEIKRLEMLRSALEQEKIIELERLQNKIDTAEAGTQARVDAEREYYARRQEFANQDEALETQIAEKKKAREIAVTDLKLQLATDGLGAVMGLAKQGSKMAKGLAVAQATMDTYKAVNAIFANASANPSTILFPAYPYIQSGIALVKGLATVKSILKTPEVATSVTAGGEGGAVSPVAPAFNVVGASDTNQLANVLAEQKKEPTRAYVVANDVTTAQSLERNIVGNASIG